MKISSKARTPLIVLRVVMVLVAILLTPKLFIQPYCVSSSGMEPTLQKGDRIIVRLWHAPGDAQKRGQIIAFKQSEKTVGISRIIGIAGDRVDTQYGKVTAINSDRTIKIAPGHVFIFGDNLESDHFAEPIAEQQIIGRVWLRLWPNWHFFSD